MGTNKILEMSKIIPHETLSKSYMRYRVVTLDMQKKSTNISNSINKEKNLKGFGYNC